jgi:hypothetical protein
LLSGLWKAILLPVICNTTFINGNDYIQQLAGDDSFNAVPIMAQYGSYNRTLIEVTHPLGSILEAKPL